CMARLSRCSGICVCMYPSNARRRVIPRAAVGAGLRRVLGLRSILEAVSPGPELVLGLHGGIELDVDQHGHGAVLDRGQRGFEVGEIADGEALAAEGG